jgi:hypothetical protein
MNAKEELTKLIMESYDRGVKDAKQEALAALEKVVAVTNNTCEKHCEATAFKIVIRGLEHEVVKLKAERDEIYGLLGSAHLELRQNIEYGYNPNTIKSTLISIGQYAPKLKAKMNELQTKMEKKHDATTE